jgi:protein involved in polysaccharide export with SLBB domain
VRRMTWAARLLLVGAMLVGAAPARTQGALNGIDLDADVVAQKTLAQRKTGLEGVQAPPAEFAGPVDPAIYRMGPGDLLFLHLWGQVTLNIPLEVGPEGTVLLPDEGLVSVAGRTLADVRADLLARMHRRYRGVNMELRLARPRAFRIYLTGQVKAPGSVSANGACRVGDVLANEMFAEGASRRRIEVLRRDGTRETCDLELFLQTGDTGMNPWLCDGDVIQVPSATEFVYAQGAVARPATSWGSGTACGRCCGSRVTHCPRQWRTACCSCGSRTPSRPNRCG